MARQPGLAPLLPPEGIRDGVEGFDDIVGGGGLRRVDQPLREGGYAVDFRGTSMEALRRMDLLDAVQAEATNMGDMYYVDRRDREVATMPAAAFSGELEIMRGDLARIFYDATKAGTEYIFGDSIAELAEFGDGVEVRFESGMHRTFDLVIGADGLHSNVRDLAFGPEEQFVRDLPLLPVEVMLKETYAAANAISIGAGEGYLI